MTILELREKRAKAWEAAKAFLDSHRKENGVLSAEDDAAYTKMEQEITDLGKEIARLERQEALDAELNRPVNNPLRGNRVERRRRTVRRIRPGAPPTITGRTSGMPCAPRHRCLRSPMPCRLARTPRAATWCRMNTSAHWWRPWRRRTSSGRWRKSSVPPAATARFPVVASKGTASWIDEEGAFPESDDSFGQVSIGAYKLGTMIKVSEELLNDSVFDLQSYISREFARRIGAKEEEAFFTGDGKGKPLGVLAAAGGAETGVTAASATAVTADELMDLYYSLKSPYRKKSVWVLNDSTIKAIRKLKDNNGQYLWQPGLIANAPDTILGRPVKTSAFMPSIAAGAKSIIFGDFKYYWIADRQGRTFKRLNELYATNGQVGFLASQRVDGKLILPEALKVLKQKAGSGSGSST